MSIDQCERAVLETSYPALREVIVSHFSEMSRKGALEMDIEGELIVNVQPYKVHGEVGRFDFTTLRIVNGDEVLFDTSCDLFPNLRSNEFYRTIGFKELTILYGDIENSFRKTSELINRIRHPEEGGTPHRTLRDNTEKEGSELAEAIESKAKAILANNGFTEAGVYEGENEQYGVNEAKTLPDDRVNGAVRACQERLGVGNEVFDNPVCYEDPNETVNVSIDDVNVKRQKDSRSADKTNGETERKYVHNTVVHVAKGEGSYILNGYGLLSVLCMVIAFLLNSDLLKYRIQFFTNGHTTLNKVILKCFFCYKNMRIILDWFHLVKKCKEQLSLAMRGRVIRNEVLRALMPLLWCGLTDQGVEYLNSIPVDKVKSPTHMAKLIDHLERNRPYIPCYAVRKQLGLCNKKLNYLVHTACNFLS